MHQDKNTAKSVPVSAELPERATLSAMVYVSTLIYRRLC